MHHTSLIRRQRIHGSLDNIQEEHEEESEEEVDLAEVDTGNDSKDSYLDSESTDNGSELTEVTMSNTSSSTRSGRRMGPTAQEEHFFSLNQCMFLTKQFFLNRILHRVNYLTFIYKRWERGSHKF